MLPVAVVEDQADLGEEDWRSSRRDQVDIKQPNPFERLPVSCFGLACQLLFHCSVLGNTSAFGKGLRANPNFYFNLNLPPLLDRKIIDQCPSKEGRIAGCLRRDYVEALNRDLRSAYSRACACNGCNGCKRLQLPHSPPFV